MLIDRRIKFAALFIAGVVLFLFLRGCFHKASVPVVPDVEKAVEPLEDDEDIRVVATDNELTIVSKNGSSTRYLPTSGNEVVSIKKDGTFKVTGKNKGMGFQVGGGAVYADKPRITLDLQVFYWNRFSVIGGVGLSVNPLCVPYLAVGYKLDQIRLNNTSLIVGITPNKNAVVGFRVEL